MKNTESNKTILLSEFYGKGATGQLIYDLSLKLSKKDKIYVISNREFKNNQSHKNTNLKLVNKGILVKNNPKSILLKTFKGLFFLFDSLIWILFNCNDGDKILIVSNPPFIGILGLISKVKGCNYFLLIQDLFPLSSLISGLLKKENLIYKLLDLMMSFIIKNSSEIIVLSDDLKKQIFKKYTKNKKITVIQNWAIEEIFPLNKAKNPFVKKLKLEKKFIIQYSGNFGRMHDIKTILLSAKRLKNKNIVFLFIGNGAKKIDILKFKNKYKLDNIIIEDYQPRNNLQFSFNASDISLVSLLPNAHEAVMPSKFYGILQARKPIIFIGSEKSFIAKYIKKEKCGICINSGDYEGLVKKLIFLIKNKSNLIEMGKNSFESYKRNFGKDKSIAKYIKTLNF